MPSFAGIQEDCEEIVTDINHRLDLRLKVEFFALCGILLDTIAYSYYKSTEKIIY